MKRWNIIGAASMVYVLSLVFLAGCASRHSSARNFGNLKEYSAYNSSPRQLLPEEYITWLKQNRFTNGELDHLPDMAVILYFADTGHFLMSAGFETNEWTVLATGSTDPNVLYVVHPKSGRPFIANRGLPGAGGVATQTAELGAMGVRKVVHIGTAGLLGNNIAETDLVVSSGSYKDGGAVMLSDHKAGKIDPVAKPDGELVRAIENALHGKHVSFREATGYTIPVFYFQSSGLVRALMTPRDFKKLPMPGYLEMEQASFFETCERMKIKAASIVAGSDRYTVVNDGVKHDYLGDTDEAVRTAFQAALEAMAKLPAN